MYYLYLNFLLYQAFSGFPMSDPAKFQSTTNAQQSLHCIPCTSSSWPLVKLSFCGTLVYLQLHPSKSTLLLSHIQIYVQLYVTCCTYANTPVHLFLHIYIQVGGDQWELANAVLVSSTFWQACQRSFILTCCYISCLFWPLTTVSAMPLT